MSTHYREQVEELVAQAESLDWGLPRLHLLEEAVRIADTHHDIPLAFNVRRELYTAAMLAGKPDLLLVHFSWCLSQSERHPEECPEHEIIWAFRWVANELTCFPQISRERIEETLTQMTQRYTRVGSTLRSVHLVRKNIYVMLGDRELSESAHRDLQRSRRDFLSDDATTERAFQVSYHFFREEYAEGIETAKPIIDGTTRDTHFEATNFAKVLVPLVRLRRIPEAMRYHLRGYRMVANNPRHIARAGNHIEFLTLTENLARATRLMEKHWNAGAEATDLSARLSFLLSTRLFLARFRERGDAALAMRFARPWELAPHEATSRERSTIGVDEWFRWVDAAARDLAGQFDARNGNDYQTSRIVKQAELLRMVQPYALPSSSDRKHDLEPKSNRKFD